VNPDDECEFFLWVDQEAAAKELLKTSQAPQAPQTPTKIGSTLNESGPSTASGLRRQRSLPQILETPFTKAKRKAASRDIPKQDDNDNQDVAGEGGAGRPTVAMDDPFTYPRLPVEYERKAARTSTISTPGQKFAERLKTGTESFPTPQSRDPNSSSSVMVSEAQLMQARDTSPTPARFNHTATLNPKGESDLIATVLDLIRADNLKLKGSTEMQIRHEIGLALDLGETKLRRHEGTISELYKRIDELETMILHLT
jgi:hypothetical protein